jgi:hypothetical protein
MVPAEGIEPPASSFVARRSVQVSYADTVRALFAMPAARAAELVGPVSADPGDDRWKWWERRESNA